MVDSTSTNSSSSSSTPTSITSPQTDWGLQLSQLLAMLGASQYDWARQQYDKGMGITEQNIASYMEMSGKGAGLAQKLIQQYEEQFAPLINQYISQAESYNSPERQRYEMGRAESTVAQATQAARDESARKLQSFGVRPDSGRYQDLITAGRIQDAAARAGAGNQAYQDTAAAGRNMLEKGVQFGQNVPGMAVNALNSAYTGITGAQSAIQSQLNTGANLMNTVPPFMNAASNANKVPPVGNKSGSSSTGSSSNKSDPNSGGNQRQPSAGGGGDGSGSSRGGGQDSSGRAPGGPGMVNMPAPGGRNGIGPPIQSVNPYEQGSSGWGDQEWAEPDWTNPDFTGIGQGDTDWTDPDFTGIGQGDDQGDDQGSQGETQDSGDASDWSLPDDSDITGSIGDSGESSGDSGYDPGTDYSNSSDYTGGDVNNSNYDDYSSYDDGYAQGGQVAPTTGGFVPRSASPSGGRQTDDIPARLNAKEYVIPADVAAHKGSEYFDRLIANSRKLRTGMSGPPPKAKMKPSLRMKPSFVSTRM